MHRCIDSCKLPALYNDSKHYTGINRKHNNLGLLDVENHKTISDLIFNNNLNFENCWEKVNVVPLIAINCSQAIQVIILIQ